ncbi:MAG: methyltransferase domain-containing protein [Deltaproteobacteria bacterium RBG_16_71_12]|nr:MAG: methyltransferase domain-containing protein [Deltaproteobacteria bacterium RBG_16_71_12]
MDLGSKNRLMPRHATLFAGEGLFARLARATCAAGCLPRKELYEAWEMARRVRRRVRGGRVVDWACGHGLLAHVMLILDDSSPGAVAFDTRLPPSADKLQYALVNAWPRLRDKVSLVEATQGPALKAGDVVVSCHACGGLTDEVLHRAAAARAFVAVLPCCHDVGTSDDGGLAGWLDASLAIDATRCAHLRQAGYRVSTHQIKKEVTPKNRLLIGIPEERAG